MFVSRLESQASGASLAYILWCCLHVNKPHSGLLCLRGGYAHLHPHPQPALASSSWVEGRTVYANSSKRSTPCIVRDSADVRALHANVPLVRDVLVHTHLRLGTSSA